MKLHEGPLTALILGSDVTAAWASRRDWVTEAAPDLGSLEAIVGGDTPVPVSDCDKRERFSINLQSVINRKRLCKR